MRELPSLSPTKAPAQDHTANKTQDSNPVLKLQICVLFLLVGQLPEDGSVAGPWVSPGCLIHDIQEACLVGQMVISQPPPRSQENFVHCKQEELPVMLPTASLHRWPGLGPACQPVPTLQKGNLRPRLRGAREQTSASVPTQHPSMALPAARRLRGAWGPGAGKAWALQGNPPGSNPRSTSLAV